MACIISSRIIFDNFATMRFVVVKMRMLKTTNYICLYLTLSLYDMENFVCLSAFSAIEK